MNIIDLSIRVAAQAAGKPLQAHGIPGGEIITEAVLRQLLLVQDEQAEALVNKRLGIFALIGGYSIAKTVRSGISFGDSQFPTKSDVSCLVTESLW
jgi:hypothetical protein